MRSVPALLAALGLLLPAGSALAAEPGALCREIGGVPGLRVCSKLDETALRRPGQWTTWRVWLEGGGAPINVRLHNNLPGVLQVKGGNDQIVHMGCSWHRRIRRKVRLIGPADANGAPGMAARPEAGSEPSLAEKLTVRQHSPSPRQEALTMAAALVPLLRRIEAEFLAERSRLSASPDYSRDEVAALLDRTETALLHALSYQELAALRDYVRQEFQRLGRTWE